METFVEFRSSKFPAEPGEEAQLNPGVWGKRLAEYLVQHLERHGIATGEMNAEDWGWFIPLANPTVPMAICCGHQDGAENTFVCFTEPSRPVVKKLFRTIDVTPQLERLTAALRQILEADADITDIVWSTPGHRH